MEDTVGSLDSNELTTAGLKDALVLGRDGTTLATVSRVDGIGLAARVIAKTCGFLGFGATTVAIPLRDLDFCRNERGGIQAASNWDLDSLKKTFGEPA
jgi:hypothetical protein